MTAEISTAEPVTPTTPTDVVTDADRQFEKRLTKIFVYLPILLLIPVLGGLAVLVLGKEHRPVPPPVLIELPPLDLIAHTGKPFRTADLTGRVWISSFIFTRCAAVCPAVTQRMSDLSLRVEGEPIGLVSFTVDPEYDTPEVLASYAKGFGASDEQWSFVTGPMDEVKAAVVAGFKLPMEVEGRESKMDAFAVLHSDRIVLVDGASRIRGYYSPGEEEKLVNDARILLSEGQ